MSMTRGEMQDLLAKFASNNPQYRSALLKNPRSIVEKQFNMALPEKLTVKAVEESADTIYVVVPHAVAAGAELDDADLEKVAGGLGDKNSTCILSALSTYVELNLG